MKMKNKMLSLLLALCLVVGLLPGLTVPAQAAEEPDPYKWTITPGDQITSTDGLYDKVLEKDYDFGSGVNSIDVSSITNESNYDIWVLYAKSNSSGGGMSYYFAVFDSTGSYEKLNPVGVDNFKNNWNSYKDLSCLYYFGTVTEPAATEKNIMLGVSGISGPTEVTDNSGKYYTPSDYIWYGTYEQDSSTDGAEPIKWRVLSLNGNSGTYTDSSSQTYGSDALFLLSEYLLENSVYFQQAYHYDNGSYYRKGASHNAGTDEALANAWQGSDAQTWAKNFTTGNSAAFSSGEQAALLATTKSDSTQNLYSKNWGESALNSDKVFFLSAEELSQYVGSYDGAPGLKATPSDSGTAYDWWLRSPFGNIIFSGNAGLVKNTGGLMLNAVNYTKSVRPAFNLNTSQVLFTSAAEGGKSSSFAQVTNYTNSGTKGWKLTLKEDGKTITGTGTGTGIADASGTDASSLTLNEGYEATALTVTHKSLSTIGNDYDHITAALTNSSGEILYYGSINTNTSATTSTVAIPTGLAAGDYTLSIYGEDWNGDKLTDYATSDAITATIRVRDTTEQTMEVPVSVKVVKGGTASVPAESFTVSAALGMDSTSYPCANEIKIEDATIDATGEGTFSGSIKLTFTAAAFEEFVENAGLDITLTNNGTTNWTYDSTEYHAYLGMDQDGKYYVDEYEVGKGTDAVSHKEAKFTATYTKNNTGGGTTYYSLTFETNGGSEIEGVRKSSGTTVDLSGYTPTREGYTFAGWYSDKELTEKISSVKLNSNKTVYAGWTEESTFENPFTDVKENDWFYEDVEYVYENGLMQGTSENQFSPYLDTTRGMIVTILYRMEKEPAVTGDCPFDDVKAGSYYEDAITWAAANGIVKGYSAEKFGPDDKITREQLATILYRYASYKGYDVSVGENTNILSFTDAEQISEYAIAAMQWACGSGLVNGKGDNTLDPQGNALRSEAAAILHRFCDTVVK